MSWTDAKILLGTYRPGAVAPVITETKLLPGATLTTIATVLQQTGAGRRRIKGKVYVTALSGYEAYVTDMYAGTTGAVLAATGTYMIEALGNPEYIQDDCVEFDCTWVEVTSS